MGRLTRMKPGPRSGTKRIISLTDGLAFPEEKWPVCGDDDGHAGVGRFEVGEQSGKDLRFLPKYFFDEAQEYFPANSYNADAVLL
ncbi:MAG: hypothetical protein ACLU4J_08700 [Butyricimonas paravirosa]